MSIYSNIHTGGIKELHKPQKLGRVEIIILYEDREQNLSLTFCISLFLSFGTVARLNISVYLSLDVTLKILSVGIWRSDTDNKEGYNQEK